MDKNIEGIVNESAESFLSLCSSDMGGIFGDPEVLPRVGDQFQAEIPPPMMEYDHFQLMRESEDTEVTINVSNCLNMGLPIPIMWIHDDAGIVGDNVLPGFGDQNVAIGRNGPVEAENSEESQIASNDEDVELKSGLWGTTFEYEETVGGLLSFQPMVAGERMDVDLALSQGKKTELYHGNNGYHPVPGALGQAWRDIEYDSFLLGLYIFGKNLLLVKRFVEKEIGDVLSYYYGKFYRSSKYHRWSECWKMRSKRCIHGQKIFMGWRHQELLSRLFSHVSEECKDRLMEVSRIFGEGKLTLDEYVFTLKDMVGVRMLAEAIAIGKGKQDLTGTTMELVKTNHSRRVHPEIPTGKACSSLTSGEIIKFLTGDFRLSKARCGDLFWEAVWPRLLARGWHSEQPKDHGCAGSKHSLVFLIPGVKKFSRRRLVKGNHYFDSVSDVLNKVASEPGLLELEIEAANGSAQREEYMVDPQTKQDPEILSDHHHRYLRPRNSNCNQDSMQFTIVDTSLHCREKQAKVRELRSLPADPLIGSIPSGLSSETEEDTSVESRDEAVENMSLHPVKDVAENGASADSPECVTGTNTHLPCVSDPMIIAVENHEDQSTSVSNDRKSRLIVKFHFRRKVKSHQSNGLGPIMKQHHLTACSHEQSSHGVENISRDTKLNGEESCGWSNTLDTCENMALQLGSSQDLLPTSSLVGCPVDSSKGIQFGNYQGSKTYPKKPQAQTLIDLNLPHVAPDSGNDEQSVVDMVHNDDNSSAKKPSYVSETSQQYESSNPANVGASIEQQSAMNGRRQSTRNRPLTTRALEALELGFFDTKKKKKRKHLEATSESNSMSRSSRQVRGKTAIRANLNDSVGTDTASHMMNKGVNGSYTGDTNMLGESLK
ncbi:unnamed protein product [Ilex paraguariensis]|uniref:SANT domain-containing protein n=1 Tax=Ilex paraguariensis TaxID=185542 RepID=A0ABC8UAI4_9AQUA